MILAIYVGFRLSELLLFTALVFAAGLFVGLFVASRIKRSTKEQEWTP